MRLKGLLQLVVTILVMVGVVQLIEPVSLMLRRGELREGWAILRPPGETSALELAGNVIWAGGMEGLTAIDWRSCKVVEVNGVPRLRAVRDLLVDTGGSLWVAHNRGVARLRDRVWEEIPWGAAAALAETRAGQILAGGDGGVARWTAGGMETVATAAELGLAGVDVLFEDRGGALWAGSMAAVNGGLMRFAEGRWEEWTGKLTHPSVTTIHEAPDGALWFGTGFGNRGGLSVLTAGEWRVVGKTDGLAGEKVRSIFRDSRGRYWIGSEYDGIAVGKGDGWRVLTPDHGLAGWEVKQTLEDPDGYLWMGTENGVSRVAPEP